jgi:TolB-like protein
MADGSDLHGDGVNVAARLEAVSPVGGICVSRAVVDHVHNRLDLQFEPIGLITLKNIARPVEAFVLRLDPTAEGDTQTVAPSGVRTSTAPRLSLVVLPFDNLGDTVEDHFVDGITEDLTIHLARFTGFLVSDRNAAFRYRGKPVDIRDVGAELGVRYAVEGRVRVVGGGLRVNVQLVSCETGMHLWADRFDLARGGGGDAVDDIVRHIGFALNGQLLNIESTRSARERPVNPDVTDLLVQARTLDGLPPNPQLLAQKVLLFERVLELDRYST